MGQVKFGALCLNQYTDWPALLQAGIRADQLGYDTLWTWDHLYPVDSDPRGPTFEGWLTITAWAQATERVRIGLMVCANPFREPALVAKMATTLDHISQGRAILGIGAAWFEEEHLDFGIEFGSGPPERLRWLGEALPIMRGMLDGTEPSAAGPRYQARHVRNLPPPVQAHLPICIGGSGEVVTLKLVARYADMCNVLGGPEVIRRKDAILREHCASVGRDHREIERTTGVGLVVIRDGPREAQRVAGAILERNGMDPVLAEGAAVGTPEVVAERLAPYLELGYRHLNARFPFDYDNESMTRLITEVKPILERIE